MPALATQPKIILVESGTAVNATGEVQGNGVEPQPVVFTIFDTQGLRLLFVHFTRIRISYSLHFDNPLIVIGLATEATDVHALVAEDGAEVYCISTIAPVLLTDQPTFPEVLSIKVLVKNGARQV